MIFKKFEEHGENLLTFLGDLWDMLISVAASQKGGELACVLDALNDCEESGEIGFSIPSTGSIRARQPVLHAAFVIIVDSKIHLLYQTALEVLVPPVTVVALGIS